MSGELKWRLIDQTNRPYHLNENDKCCYFMDYQSRGAPSVSEANQRISNLKRSPKYKGQAPWNYKIGAVNIFANNLVSLFGQTQEYTVAFIPSSKKKDDSEYDERFDLLRNALAILASNLRIEEPIVTKLSRVATHLSSDRPKPNEIKETYQWNGFQNQPFECLYLIDDVITTGAQFRAYKDLVLEHQPDLKILGVFWAKTFWPNPSEGMI